MFSQIYSPVNWTQEKDIAMLNCRINWNDIANMNPKNVAYYLALCKSDKRTLEIVISTKYVLFQMFEAG